MPKRGTSTSVMKSSPPRGKAAAHSVGKSGGKARRAPVSRSLTVAASTAPMGVSSAYRFSSSTSDETVRGTDFLATVNTASCVDGAILMDWYVSPTQINSRLGQIAKLWERYQFKKIRLFYIPCVPTTTAGQLTLAYDPDSTDVTPVSYTRETLFALDDNVTGSVFSPIELYIRKLDQNTLYYTGANSTSADERTELQGQVYVAYTGPTVSSSTTFGTLMIEYEVHFSKRTYDASVPASLPEPGIIAAFVNGTINVLPTATSLLSGLYALNHDWNQGFVPVGPNGVIVPNGADRFLEIASAVNLVGAVAGTPVGAYWNAVASGLNVTTPVHLMWSTGKSIASVLGDYSDGLSGTVSNGTSLTSCVEQTTETATCDYFIGGVHLVNRSGADISVDFGVSFVPSPTTAVLRGIRVFNLSFDLARKQYATALNTVLATFTVIPAPVAPTTAGAADLGAPCLPVFSSPAPCPASVAGLPTVPVVSPARCPGPGTAGRR